MGDLATDTELVGSDGKYQIELSKAWEGIGTPNGGYLAAIAIRAAGEYAKLPRPASFSCQYLSIPRFEAVDIQVSRLSQAKRAEALQVNMSQGGKLILMALVWVVDSGLKGLQHDSTPKPNVPPPNELPEASRFWEEEGIPISPCWRNVDCRLVDPHWDGRTRGRAVDHTWHRFIPYPTYEDPFVDAGRLLYLIDACAYWPAGRAQGISFTKIPFFAPNIDLTAQFHRDASSEEWLFLEAVSPAAGEGLVSGQVRIWSRRDQLLASGTSTLLSRPNPLYVPD